MSRASAIQLTKVSVGTDDNALFIESERKDLAVDRGCHRNIADVDCVMAGCSQKVDK